MAVDDTGAFDRAAARRALEVLRATELTARDKGFAGLLPTDPARTPAAFEGARLDHPALSTPAFVLRESALEHNLATMADFCRRQGVRLAPHAKTTMMPELFVRQLEAGAFALTGASVAQARVFADFGARRILIANEVTDPGQLRGLAALLTEYPALEVLCCVDSEAGVALLESVGASAGRAPLALLEWGVPGGRAGVRDRAGAERVARAAAASAVPLVGLSAFEGPLGRDGDASARVETFFTAMRETAEALVALGLIDLSPHGLVLSGGGSHDFDVVARVLSATTVAPATVVIRSGSYLPHDHGDYALDTPAARGADLAGFRPAIEVHGTVLSRPEPERAYLDVGRRDVSFDSGLPIVTAARRGATDVDVAGLDVTGVEVIGLNDQHAFLTLPADSALRPGDRVILGISHPCTTFDKWRLALLADDADRITGVGHTFF